MNSLQKAIESRSFNITDSVHKIIRLTGKGNLVEAREEMQDMRPPKGHSKAVLPITQDEYKSIKLVARHNPSVCVFVMDKEVL